MWFRVPPLRQIHGCEVKRLRCLPVTQFGAGSTPVTSAKFREVDQLVDRVVWDHRTIGPSGRRFESCLPDSKLLNLDPSTIR